MTKNFGLDLQLPPSGNGSVIGSSDYISYHEGAVFYRGRHTARRATSSASRALETRQGGRPLHARIERHRSDVPKRGPSHVSMAKRAA